MTIQRKSFKTDDVSDFLAPLLKKVYIKAPPVPHKLEAFFRDRQISWQNLAKKIGVTRMSINNWMTGQVKPRPEHEEKLMEVHDKILVWEKKNGRLFNSDPK